MKHAVLIYRDESRDAEFDVDRIGTEYAAYFGQAAQAGISQHGPRFGAAVGHVDGDAGSLAALSGRALSRQRPDGPAIPRRGRGQGQRPECPTMVGHPAGGDAPAVGGSQLPVAPLTPVLPLLQSCDLLSHTTRTDR